MIPTKFQIKPSKNWKTATYTVLGDGEVVPLVRHGEPESRAYMDSVIIKGHSYFCSQLEGLGFKPYERIDPVKFSGIIELNPGNQFLQIPIRNLNGRKIKYTIEEVD